MIFQIKYRENDKIFGETRTYLMINLNKQKSQYCFNLIPNFKKCAWGWQLRFLFFFTEYHKPKNQVTQ